LNKNYDSVFTATEEKTFCWLDGERINFNLPRIQTQFLKPVFVETSGIYGYKKHVLDLGSRTSNDNFNIIKVSKLESIDIDTLDDFYFAEKVGRSIINDGGLL
jgi:CMP-N-acetylneuraminic acid synthetase